MTDVVLITGGLGYIGGRLAQQLAACGKHRLRLTTRSADCAPPAWLPGAEVVRDRPAGYVRSGRAYAQA